MLLPNLIKFPLFVPHNNEIKKIKKAESDSSRNDVTTTTNSQRLNQTSNGKSSFTSYKTTNGTKSNLNCILQNYSANSILMKGSSSGSEKDSMTDDSDGDESDVDIMGDDMLC